jgi:putative membrane protein (TIGR04086 family)
MEGFKNRSFITIIKGTVISVVITLLLLFIFAIILTYTGVSETMIPAVIIVITAISLLIGSSIANKKIKKNGILNGGMIGGIYLLTLYIISSVINGSFSIGLKSIIMITIGILFGIIGGIIGVNSKKS